MQKTFVTSKQIECVYSFSQVQQGSSSVPSHIAVFANGVFLAPALKVCKDHYICYVIQITHKAHRITQYSIER